MTAINLHQIVRSAIPAVNPDVPVTIRVSNGYTTASDGSRTPAYTSFDTTAQVQALTSTDLRKLDGQNIQGSTRKLYLNGSVSGVDRLSQDGGDLVTLADGTVWLTTMVLEQWPDWCSVSITRQMDSKR